MKDDSKNNTDNKSSADGVIDYLQALDDKDGQHEQLYYSQEQSFSSDELAGVINEQRLAKLLAQSDDFLNSLTVEIEDFDQDSDKDNH
ncbi:hypothetical protein KPY62_11995 [Psychrobacter sp. TAE2020]|uniref:hypothetical protein n=1 Tax=Psychrobacter sp. TAE2020 TaxID=2846762 RepID=UPI001C1227AA|nr:hypothetical protein [Psychrobacter sp. TAE2020]MBU5617798.1 hypothetical protein [Psychrobacter sp. TAE2020]